MKQKICLSILTGVSLSVIPFVSQASLGMIQSGFFVGLAPNITAMDYGYTDNAPNASIKQSATPILIKPDMYVGYGSLMSSNNIYVGFALGAQVKSSKTTEVSYYNNTPVTNNASQGMSYYADFMPGLVFSDQSSVFYAVIGAADSSFTFKQENGSSPFSLTESHFGYRFGAGYLLALSDSFSINAKVVYSNFGSIQFDQSVNNNYELNPQDGQFSIGVNYTFGASEPGTASPFLGD